MSNSVRRISRNEYDNLNHVLKFFKHSYEFEMSGDYYIKKFDDGSILVEDTIVDEDLDLNSGEYVCAAQKYYVVDHHDNNFTSTEELISTIEEMKKKP